MCVSYLVQNISSDMDDSKFLTWFFSAVSKHGYFALWQELIILT